MTTSLTMTKTVLTPPWRIVGLVIVRSASAGYVKVTLHYELGHISFPKMNVHICRCWQLKAIELLERLGGSHYRSTRSRS